MNVATMYHALSNARTVMQVRAILDQVGDSHEVRPLTPLRGLGLCWFPFGGREANIATINVATHAGRSLTERITNAMDAVLEDGYDREQKSEPTPRIAAEKWFRRPHSGPNAGLFQINYRKSGLSRLVNVVLLDSGIEGSSTIEVYDRGIGIASDRFPETILSLNENNKLTKTYVSGRFGQGGSSTLSFSEYVIILSRAKQNPNEIAFTIIRKINPGENYVEDMYAYLAFKGPSDKPIVPQLKVPPDEIVFDTDVKGVVPPSLGTGTLVRHVGYRLTGLESRLSASPGNLYHYLHCSLMDPIFPFMLFDLRSGGRARSEVIAGSRNRLMRLAERNTDATSDEETIESDEIEKTQMRHYSPMEFVVPFGKQEATIGIEYWLPLCFRKSAKKSDELVIRSYSNELYVERGFPIVVTMNGQNQGQIAARLLREIGLGMVSKHVVVHVDASRCDKDTRQKLFATTRENLKDDTVLKDLLRTITEMFRSDEVLYETERDLTDKLTSDEAERSSDDVKRQVIRLLEEAGMKKTQTGAKDGGGAEESNGGGGSGGGGGRPKPPIETLPFPEVTYLKIVSPKSEAQIPLDGRTSVAIETDGDEMFDIQGSLTLTIDSPSIEVASFTKLRNGRKQWRLRPTTDSNVGDVGSIRVVLAKPTGETLTDMVTFRVTEKKPPQSKVVRGNIPDFDIIGIHPVDNADLWNQVWSEVSADSENISDIAFTVVRASDKLVVYYSKVFGSFAATVDKLKTSQPALVVGFETNYKVWIGYHAILQQQQGSSEEDSMPGQDDNMSAKLEEYKESERGRIASVQVKQSLELAKLQHRLTKESAGE